MKYLLGTKINMTQMFAEDGTVSPVTVIEATPSKVTQVKTKEKDGYTALQIGFKKIEKKNKIKTTLKPQPLRPHCRHQPQNPLSALRQH